MLSKFSVKKPFTIMVAVVLIIVFGFVSFTRMTPDLFPKIDLPFVMVMTSYPGASSEEIEKSISEPLEEQLASLGNLKNVNSQSQKGISMIFLEFNEDANLDVVSVDIRDKIDFVKDSFIDGIMAPIIFKMNPEMMPVVVSSVSKENSNLIETSTIVEEELQRKLEGIDGVAKVSTSGLVDNKIHVRLNQKKIDKINQKINSQVNSQVNLGKGQINNGIAQVNQGVNGINNGKNQITASQKKLAEQSETIKSVLATLFDVYKEKEKLEYANNRIKMEIASKNPGLTNAQIEGIAMKNGTYAGNVVAIVSMERNLTGIKKGLYPIKDQLMEMGIHVDKLNSTKNVSDAQRRFNIFVATTNANLANSMAELTGSGALLQASKMQLEAQLGSLKNQTQGGSKGDFANSISVDTISQLITAQNFEMPAGMVSEDGNDILVTVGNKMSKVADVSDLVIMNLGIKGIAPIKLSDVADVSYLNNGDETYSKVNGKDGVLISFSKQSNFATATVSDNINKKLNELEKEYDGLKFNILSDQGDYIHLAISSVINNLIMGGILSILILFLFLRDIKPTFITACSIPISVTFAIALMYFSGVTINMISLAGLAVGVGMLVDNSIVVIENIYRLRMSGYTKVKAAILGAKQVAGAITASTLTTICVFVPIVFADGITKTIFTDMALTVTYSLLASLFIALTLVPVLGSTILNTTKDNTILSMNSKFILKYKKVVASALNHRIVVLIVAVLLLISSVAICIYKGFEFVPSMATKEISATITLPKNSDIKEMKKVCDTILEDLYDNEVVDTAGVMLDSGMAGMMGISMGESSESATIYVLLKEDFISEGKKISNKIIEEGESQGCKVKVNSDMNMMAATGGMGISLNVYSDDLDDLRVSAQKIENELNKINGIYDVSKTSNNTSEEIKIVVDKEKAMKYGLTTA